MSNLLAQISSILFPIGIYLNSILLYINLNSL